MNEEFVQIKTVFQSVSASKFLKKEDYRTYEREK